MNAISAIAPTPNPQIAVERLVVLEGVSWQTFKALLADIGGSRVSRVAYDRGVLEIRMPLTEHEESKRLIESFIEVIVDELEIEARSLGALLLKREDLTRAIEPDSCFYIQNESRVRGKKIQLPDDPPPDLAIEADYTSSSLDKFNIYASIGVPELWRYRQQTLEVYQLVGENYERSQTSIAFPFLPIAEVPTFIEQSKTTGQRAAVRLFRQRIQGILQNAS
ncbi:Uma2 family endonuclease [Aliterella atlantica]|uniref:Uma2 family endonuclease n=1 Tax=Aliterella atlantica TaxID=1827278 RepID=UPI0005D46538|nr:Uma2 family endonuclease [Aliterella atlantica]